MKRSLSVVFFLFILLSCKKDINGGGGSYIDQVKQELKDSMAATDYAGLNFDEVRFSAVDSINLYLLRIPFKGKNISNDFVLLQTDKEGHSNKGKIVHLSGNNTINEETKTRVFNGIITLSSLNRQSIVTSPVTNGYIKAFHRNNTNQRLGSLAPTHYKMLPEVIVVGTRSSNGDSFSNWVLLQSLVDGGGGGGGSSGGSGDSGGGSSISGYYNPMNPSSDDDGSNDGSEHRKRSGTPDHTIPDPPIQIDFEYGNENPAIDLLKYVKCFDAIPDDGATCSIEIFSDIPVNDDPRKAFDWRTESPGHTFIQIKKFNSVQYVSQNIGFYPNAYWKSILNYDPVESKFVDNTNHEFDASLFMNLTPYNLHIVLDKIRSLAAIGLKYDMDEYNCTDFTLQVFNSARLIPLDIVKMDIPGGMTINGSNTPQGLYLTLEQMKVNNSPEAANITVGNVVNWVGVSNGPCN